MLLLAGNSKPPVNFLYHFLKSHASWVADSISLEIVPAACNCQCISVLHLCPSSSHGPQRVMWLQLMLKKCLSQKWWGEIKWVKRSQTRLRSSFLPKSYGFSERGKSSNALQWNAPLDMEEMGNGNTGWFIMVWIIWVTRGKENSHFCYIYGIQ